MSRSRRSATALSAAAALAVLTACSGQLAGGGEGTTAPAGDPVAGGTLTLGYAAGAGCIDPHQLADALTVTVGRQITDSLTWQDEESGEILPALAESWEIAEDGRAYTFTLREGVTFSDGAAVDAEAVAANFQDLVDLGARSIIGASYVASLENVEAVDASTVRFELSEPSAQFLQATSTATTGLLSPATLELDPEQRCAGDLVGSGPFLLADYVADQSVTLGQRADYDWAPPDAAQHEGAAYLDEVVFQVVPEPSVRTGSLQSSQLDGIESVQPVDQAGLADAGLQVLARSNPGMVNVLIPNEERPNLQDSRVRQALQVAIDRDAILETIWNTTNYSAATSVLAANTPGHTDLSDLLAYDPDAAGQLLDEAGWALGAEGFREKDGEQLTLSLLGGGPDTELLQQQLREVGVDLQLRSVEAGEYLEVLGSGDYDLASYNLTRPDPSVLTAIYSTAYQNVPRLQSGELDEALAAVDESVDPAARDEAAAEVQRIILEEAHAIPTTEQAQVYGLGSSVQGVTLDASSRVYLYDTWKQGE